MVPLILLWLAAQEAPAPSPAENPRLSRVDDA